jgi:hypothetical protein
MVRPLTNHADCETVVQRSLDGMRSKDRMGFEPLPSLRKEQGCTAPFGGSAFDRRSDREGGKRVREARVQPRLTDHLRTRTSGAHPCKP